MQRAAELIGEYDRYANLFSLNVEGAEKAFDGNAQAASALAKGIYDGSKASVKFGSKFVLGPSASRLVDQAYNGLDFLLNAQEVGVPTAAREALRRALVDVIFDVVPISELKDKTLSDVLGDGANKVIGSSGLYRLFDAAVRSPQFQKELMKVLAAAGRTVTVDTAKALVEKMLADSAAPLAGVAGVSTPDAPGSTTSVEAVSTCSAPIGKEGLSGQEAALALGPARDYYRANAIEAMVKGGILRVPLCGIEMGLMLKGATGEHRARAIAALVKVARSDLTGVEGAAMLGTPAECAEYYRANAISALAKGKRFKSNLSGKELAMILDGTTGEHRARAIAAISEK